MRYLTDEQREQRTIWRRKYREEHRAELNAYNKAYRQAHKDEINARRRELALLKRMSDNVTE